LQRTSRRETALIAGLLLGALLLRTATVVVQFDKLAVDRDGYLGIAHSLADGNGYSSAPHNSGEPQPTAYRPPLYPLVLAGIFRLSADEVGIAALQILLGTLTVLLTFLAGRRLGLGRAAYFAAGLVACDPLLLQYSALPMTETLCTFLVTLLLTMLVHSLHPTGDHESSSDSELSAAGNPSQLNLTLIGGLFGLCLLCRPTIAVFGLFGLLWWLAIDVRNRSIPPLNLWPVALAAAVVVAPWMIRNQLVIGRPTPATTHGGYTLLLGNNPVFYHEVVEQPWGTVWDTAAEDHAQAFWLTGVEAALDEDLGDRANDEPSRDRWMYRRACRNIADEPGLFLRACGLRFVRFWNVIPLGPAREAVPPLIVACVGLFYALELFAFLLGTITLMRKRSSSWCCLLLVIAAFSLVHLFFWSNMRMRAPVIPAIALIAMQGVGVWVDWGRYLRQKISGRCGAT
jgi:4-amino-4-deoxy-L-arabinose transferase-like glycosyltransferase